MSTKIYNGLRIKYMTMQELIPFSKFMGFLYNFFLKENYIKEVADEYKSKYPNFPIKLYEAMYKWEVSIND